MTITILKLEGKLTELKPEKSKAGVTYYTFKVADKSMSWWPPQDGGDNVSPRLLALGNKQVATEYTETQKDTHWGPKTYRNLVSISQAEEPKAEPAAIGLKPDIITTQFDDGMSKAEWAQKDRISRDSIESQTAFKGMVELLVAKIILPEGVLGKAALDWAASRLGAVSQPEEKAKIAHMLVTAGIIDEKIAKAFLAEEPAEKPAIEDTLAPIKDYVDFLARFKALNPKMTAQTLFGIAGITSWKDLSGQPVDQLTELWIEVLSRWGAEKAKKGGEA